MKRLAVFLLLAVPGIAAPGTAAPTIVGNWNLTATDAGGVKTNWTLVVNQNAGNLSGAVRSSDGYELPFLEPKFEAGELRFQIRINPTELITVTLKLDGDRLTGRFEGRDSGTGSIQATRVLAPNLSGTWTGEWETSPDGGPGPHYMVLKQDGGRITGSAGPNDQIQLAIEHAKFAAGHLTFDIALPSGPALAFDFTVSGDAMSGIAVFKRNGTEQRLKLAAKRQSAGR